MDNKKKAVNIVWLKKDLRTQDHAAFHAAEKSENDYLVIYIFEPTALAYPDRSLRHSQFIYHSILNMNELLQDSGREVVVFHTEAVDVFAYLHDQYTIDTVFSYQESGIRQTWVRDKAVAKYLKSHGTEWVEYQRDGIVRGLKDIALWDNQWNTFVNEKIIANQFSRSSLVLHDHPFPIQESLLGELKDYPDSFQKAGENFAWKYLRSFCQDRGKNYCRDISKPSESRKSCGRISPYLSWGNFTIKQVAQYVSVHPNYERYNRGFVGMLTRLKWHCHFIQRFETDCDYETICANRAFESMEFTNDLAVIEAWENAKTGFPLVDACMNCLKETGWINFRMRAMLVSMLCHHFDCDWRKGMYHLARLFLDYEPGIHYPQFQMQAGTTDINTVRIYNPIKQSKDHDPKGTFIKKWVKELKDIPIEFIHEPMSMTQLDKQYAGIELHYPAPIVSVDTAAKKAREKIWGYRNSIGLEK